MFGRLLTFLTIAASAGLAPAEPLHTCVSPEDWHLLPKEYREKLEQSGEREARGTALTPVLVDIDPHGAVGDVPWTCHLTTQNIRSAPTVNGSTVLGSISQNQQFVMEYYVVAESDEEWLKFTFNNQEGWASRLGLYRPHPLNVEALQVAVNLEYNTEIINRWWGIPLTYEPNDLQTVPLNYAVGSGRRLRAEVLEHVILMIDAARADGQNFLVSSPYRSGPTQQTIYVNNTQNNLSQRFSAPPGHSEHQLGATIDFTDPSDNEFLENTDPQQIWMVQNAGRFGFRQSYTATNEAETGYIEEPWHWRYIGVEATTSRELWSLF